VLFAGGIAHVFAIVRQKSMVVAEATVKVSSAFNSYQSYMYAKPLSQ
jgi:hypothetical protein